MIAGLSWIKLTYSDSSERIFRGTQNIEIIRDFHNSPIAESILKVDGNLKDNYIFDIKNNTFIDTELVEVSTFKSKPEYIRRVDKFAGSFI